VGETSTVPGATTRPRAADADEVWSAFLSEQAPLILQVVHLFERDADQVQDCFLFVCEHLRRDGLRRIRKFREKGPASFATWLRAVVRHLCLDWRRHRDGRFRLPRAVARLPELDREVFRSVHLRGLTENETFHTLKALWPALTRDQLTEAAARVARAVDGRFSWLLLMRRPRIQSLSAARPGTDPAEGEAGLVDPRADPERDAAEHERLSALGKALAFLPARARLLIRLRFDQELPLEEVARLTGLSGASQVERQLRQALDDLRGAMTARGFPGVSVKGKQRP
jgi:RNA polymerase sigma factor (sigma-70 family)